MNDRFDDEYETFVLNKKAKEVSEYWGPKLQEEKDKLLARLKEMQGSFLVKRGTARFNEEADYWEGAADATAWIIEHIKRGDWDGS